jgi:hypothetical protein
MNTKLCLIAAACLAVILSLGLDAQTPTGAIEGDITDPSGAVVAGAKITVTEIATGRAIPIVSNEIGRYSVRNLIPGAYRITVSATGFATKSVENVMVSTGQVVNGNIALEIGKAGEVISVAAEAVSVDTARQTVDSVVTAKDIAEVPLFSRNFLELAALAPGTLIRDGGSIDPTKERAYRVVGVAGRSGTATRVQVDGIDVTDETVGTTVANYSDESVSEFQLTRSSLDPSTSLTSSGAVNIISKQGGNAVHGTFFTDYYNQDMGARINYNQTEAYPFNRKRVGGSAGGPIKKDKLFWFGAVERHYQEEQSVNRSVVFPMLNVNQGFPIGIRYVDTRMDWNAAPSVRVFGKFHHDWNLATGGSAISPFQTINWTNTVALGVDVNKAHMTHSYRFGYLNFNNRIESQELTFKFLRTPNNIPYALSVGPSGTFGPNNLAPQATYQDNWQNSYEGSWFKGRHSVRFGFDVRRVILGGFANFAGPLSVTGTYDDATVADLKKAGKNLQDPTEYPLEYFSMGPANGFFNLAPAHGLPHGGHFITRMGSFVQDSFKMHKTFTLNLGLRWQYDWGYFADQSINRAFKKNPNDAIPFMDRWGKGFSTNNVVPKDMFSPSFGFAWNPKGDGKTVIRGGFYRAFEMNILNNTMFDEFAMLPNGLGPDLYEIYGVTGPDGTPLNVDGKHADGDYSDLIGMPIKQAMGVVGQLQAALSNAYSTYKFDPNKGVPAFISSGGLYYGAVYPGNQYKMPYSLQFNIGVQRELKPGTVLTADYIFNHGIGLPFTRYDYELRRDASTLQVGAAQTKINSVLKGQTVDQWIAANPRGTIGSFGLITDAIFMGLYPDMTRARFIGGGFVKYKGLQVSLRGSDRGRWKFRDLAYVVSYALARSESINATERAEFIAVAANNRKPNDKAYFGPTPLDHTHMLTAYGAFTIPGGFRFNSVWRFQTPRSYSLTVPNLGGATSGTNLVFAADLNGDNNPGADPLPGTSYGQWGRSVKSFQDVNKLINQFNSQYAGQITPHGKALVAAGLFTEAQLKKLGAVMPTIPLVPEGNPWPWHNLFTTDLSFTRPTKLSKLREGLTIIPFVDFYNLFNHSPAGPYSGLAATYGNLNFDYAKGAASGQGPSDLDITRGRQNTTRRVMVGVKVNF